MSSDATNQSRATPNLTGSTQVPPKVTDVNSGGSRQRTHPHPCVSLTTPSCPHVSDALVYAGNDTQSYFRLKRNEVGLMNANSKLATRFKIFSASGQDLTKTHLSVTRSGPRIIIPLKHLTCPRVFPQQNSRQSQEQETSFPE